MKKTKIAFWASTVFIFLFEGIMPISTLLFAPEYANAGTKPLGYPDYFANMLIVCKFLGSLAILILALPARVREWAYAGLTFNLIFATFSHIIVDGNPGYIAMPLVILAILAVSYVTQGRVRSAATKRGDVSGLALQGLGAV